MANSATLVASVPRQAQKGTVLSYRIAIDTANTDLTIHTPSALNRVFLVGQTICDGTPVTLSYYTDNILLVSLEFGPNQGMSVQVQESPSWTLATAAGQPLVIRASDSVTSGLIHVVEAPALS